MATPITPDDLGDVFQRKDGTLWRLIAHTSQPTVTFELIEQGRQVAWGGAGGAAAVMQQPARVNASVDSPLAAEFIHLVPEEEPT